jgi:predicted metal-dependent HD superfamily phosphohydrolase
MIEFVRAVVLLGGAEDIAKAAAAELEARYADPHRRYHDTAHVQAVVRDSAELGRELGLSDVDCATLTLAAAAHDVIYDGEPGQDERRSAAWIRDHLIRAGVKEIHVARVEALVLATMTHSAPPEDLAALALLDADLAILGADEETYERYRIAVRAEYSALDEATWRAGRSAVLNDLIQRNPLYATEVARARWEQRAKANLARELGTG